MLVSRDPLRFFATADCCDARDQGFFQYGFAAVGAHDRALQRHAADLGCEAVAQRAASTARHRQGILRALSSRPFIGVDLALRLIGLRDGDHRSSGVAAHLLAVAAIAVPFAVTGIEHDVIRRGPARHAHIEFDLIAFAASTVNAIVANQGYALTPRSLRCNCTHGVAKGRDFRGLHCSGHGRLTYRMHGIAATPAPLSHHRFSTTFRRRSPSAS